MTNAQVAQQASQQQQVPIAVQQPQQNPIQTQPYPVQQMQYPVQQQMQYPVQQQMVYPPQQQFLSNNMQQQMQQGPIVVPISNSNRAGYYGSRQSQTRQPRG